MCVGASVNSSKAQAVERPFRHKAYRLVTGARSVVYCLNGLVCTQFPNSASCKSYAIALQTAADTKGNSRGKPQGESGMLQDEMQSHCKQSIAPVHALQQCVGMAMTDNSVINRPYAVYKGGANADSSCARDVSKRNRHIHVYDATHTHLRMNKAAGV